MELNEKLIQTELQKQQFYRETIFSVTGGKLSICDESALEPYIASSDLSTDITKSSKLHDTREKIKEYCSSFEIPQDRLESYLLAVGECLTNTIKHGGGGTACAGHDNEKLWVIASDQGCGIDSLVLPKAVLMRGFSTAVSLGLGYSIILEYSDEVLLKTDKTGTSVALLLNLGEVKRQNIYDSLPDTW